MFCNTLQGILKTCDTNLGGIVAAWFNNGEAISSFTSQNGVVNAITLDSGANDFVPFQFNPNTSNYVENTSIDLTTGSTFYTQIVTLVLSRRETAKRQSLLLITQGQPDLTVLIKDSNGLYWIFGLEDDKMFLTGNEGGSGTAKADQNGYTLTFTSESKSPAYEVSEQIAQSIIATGSSI